MRRAVLDTNVLVSALVARDGPPARLLAAWTEGAFELIVSPLLLGELGRALAYPRLRRRIAPADAEELLRWLIADAVVASDPSTLPSLPLPDPADAFVVALAMAESAVLVTGDRALLVLGEDLPIRAPAVYLAEVNPA